MDDLPCIIGAEMSEDMQYLFVRSSLVDKIQQAVPGAVLHPDGRLQVPWTQEVCELLGTLRAPLIPAMARDYDWPGRYTPFPHQFKIAGFLASHPRAFCLADLGCVDADTEYLSPSGWKRIADYTGGSVAQYHPDTGVAEFVEPTAFVAKPCDHMFRFKTTRGVDQMLSPEHRVLYHHPETGAVHVESAASIAGRHHGNQQGFKGRFPVCFNLRTDSSLPLSDAAIRVQVAVIADGSFPSDTGSRCVVRVKKERKKDRMRTLLRDAGIEWSEVSPDYDPGYTRFTFYAPRREKEFTGWWYGASSEQLRSVADEVAHWDGSVRGGRRDVTFATRSAISAEFIQYAFVATGRAASIGAYVRSRERDAGSVDYAVNVRGGRSALSARTVSLSSTGDVMRKDDNVTLVPAPGGMKYCFMVPSTFLVLRRNGCVFCSGNTGKTISSMWAIDYLMRLGRIKRALIIGPLSILRSAWLDEVNKSFPWMEATILHHDDPIKRRRRALSATPIHITNYSGVEVCFDELMANDYDLIVVDESTSLKKYGTRRWKFMRPLAEKARYLWMLTGTPAVQYPVDAFGQVKMVYQHWDMSESRFKSMTMEQHSKYRWVPLATAAQTVYDVMQPAIRVAKRDVLKDLPPVTLSTREVELTKAQRDAMRELRKAAMLTVGGTTISAVHAAALRTKLVQIASGVVYDDERNEVQIDFAPRAKELVDVVAQVRNEAPRRGPVGGKVIVLCAFTHTVERVASILKEAGFNFGVMHGGTSLARRTEMVREFQESHELDGIVAIPDVMSHGLTLTAANTTVWFTPIDKAEVALQANNRMDRPGQIQNMHIIRLSGCAAEELMYQRLDKRFDSHHDLVSLYKEFVDAL